MGDIDAVIGNADDQSGDNGSAVYSQAKGRQTKKSKKAKAKASPSVVQTQHSVMVTGGVPQPESSADTVAVTANCGALDPRATETTELQSTVEQLTTVVHAQQTIIDDLTRKLNFVLSFLDINNDTGIENRDDTSATPMPSCSVTIGTEPSSQQHEPANLSGTANRVSYSNVAAAGASGRRSASNQPVNFREAVATAIHADRRDKDRRAKSVVVSGLIPRHDLTDAASFRQLCSQEIGLDPVVVYTKRLGAAYGDRVQPLLVGLQSPDEVLSVMSRAKSLRRSAVETVRNNVFINHNLTKVEARIAYEERCRRRLRRQGVSQHSSQQLRDDRQEARLQPSYQPTVTEQSEDGQRQSSVDGGRPNTDRAVLASISSVGSLSQMSSPAAAAAGRHRE